MNKVRVLLLAGMVLSGLFSAQAESLSSMRLRGTITGVTSHEMQVRTREGKDVAINLTGDTKISLLYSRKLRDIKQGNFVGLTAVPKEPGSPLKAREVHIFTEAQRGMGEGHYDWDLEPGSSMTNANVDAISNSGPGKELTLGYKGGSQKIDVAPDTPVVAFKPADKSALKKGAHIFCIAQQAADGSLTALRITVGKDGMAPPM
jgi:hypothetical protein